MGEFQAKGEVRVGELTGTAGLLQAWTTLYRGGQIFPHDFGRERRASSPRCGFNAAIRPMIIFATFRDNGKSSPPPTKVGAAAKTLLYSHRTPC